MSRHRIFANFTYLGLLLMYLGYSAFFNIDFIAGSSRNFAAAVPELVRGQATKSFEDLYRHETLYRDWSVKLFGTLRYRLFGEGHRGVIVGKNGWLFTSEEFETKPDAAERLDAAVTFASVARDRLRKHGSTLIVALVPEKADIYNEYLGRFRLPAEPAGRYSMALAKLGAKGIAAPDLRVALRNEKNRGQVFLKTDTHWSPRGAMAAAGAVATAWLGGRPSVERRYNLQRKDQIEISGDLAKFLGGSIAGKEAIPAIVAVEAKQGEFPVDLFGGDKSEAVLVGTSYSANHNWAFEAALKASLGEDVINAADQGLGPFKPMRNYLESLSRGTAPARLVVWEIPVRFLLDFDAPGELPGETPAVTARK